MAVGHVLGPLRERVVFVGGAEVKFYSTTLSGTPEPRVTEDVDCIVEVAPRTAFYQLGDELRAWALSTMWPRARFATGPTKA